MVSTVQITPEQRRRENELANQWQYLVLSIVEKLTKRGKIPVSQVDEAISSGFLGLTRACRKWNPNYIHSKTGKSVQFNTYAYTCIERAISKELSSKKYGNIVICSSDVEIKLTKFEDKRLSEERDQAVIENFRDKFDSLTRGLKRRQLEIFKMYYGISEKVNGRISIPKLALIYSCDPSVIKRIINHVNNKLGSKKITGNYGSWNSKVKTQSEDTIEYHDIPNHQPTLFEEVA